ncbi:hypothetical protein B1H18_12445 [Streptomyces tsukubensis]|uniref:CASTOR ACT domain-containing protein n=1 Tax=Streptomyces tsukubensis TaxID=83656 RepID=A0A1V4AB56_9ACTN|nr:hypothetical protein B1H18_12445 [Streptomyces tsukubensis]
MAGWITLRVRSALDAVGLTAAVATELAHAELSCNVVAGFHHDHLFVPYGRAEEAVALLERLAGAPPDRRTGVDSRLSGPGPRPTVRPCAAAGPRTRTPPGARPRRGGCRSRRAGGASSRRREGRSG